MTAYELTKGYASAARGGHASGLFDHAKRSFDIVAAVGLLAVLAPLFLILALIVRRDGGPIFFRHVRIGRNGQRFQCLKFRTMVPDAEQRLAKLLAEDARAAAEWAQSFKLRHDPRITRIGCFLRKTSLDELPQLFNVLTGSMSLVGPRPIVEDELRRYGEAAALYLMLRPGLTGMWQINGRNDTSYEERVRFDAWYALNRSLWTDTKILVATVPAVMRKRGAC